MLRMDSDLDSDGSHISATPPSSPSPRAASSSITRRREILMTTTKQRTKLKPSSSNSRIILRPKITKKTPNSPPKVDPVEKAPNSPPKEDPIEMTPNSPPKENPPPVFSNLPFQIKRTSGSRRDDNASDVLMLHGGRCSSKFASFSKNPGKNLKFETDEYIPEASLRDVKGKIPSKDLNLASSEFTSEASVRDVKDDCFVERNVRRKNVDLIGGHGQESALRKRVRGIGEGNFVKLNINGRGRKKFKYKNKMKGFSSSRRRKFFKKSKPSAGDESVVPDEEGFSMDMENRGRERLHCDHSSINEVVMKVRNEISDENLVELLKLIYGYDSFREGQLEAIKMVLSGKSTMLILPTGAGKSLCYQLPALVLPGATLVVSPLVSLMIDQLKQLPPIIPGGLLCGSQTAEESAKTIKSLQEGEIKVLYISPERFLNAEFISIFSGTSLLSLVVVDEAHCVSEWSHNFRPSYMRLRASLLRDRLNSGCILAMTATATTRTLCDVMHALEIPETNLIKSAKLRNNLHLSVSINGNRIKDLMALLKSPPFVNIKSIIIYCKFQSETDMIRKYLCDNNISAMSYHSGISAKDRSRVQDMFCSGKIRVVVATVAFGMGLDKKDVGAVIHYGLPESLEEYVQEIGRAGRDGRSSYCHLFFDDSTYFKLRSLAYSEGVDEYSVNKLLSQIFSSRILLTGEICSLIKESASRKFDMKAEVILTILTQLELGEVKYVHLLPEINVTCTLNFHQTSPPLLAAGDPIVSAILKKSEIKDGQYVFHIPSVANSMRLQALDLLNHLQSLKFKGEVTYELKDQAFCYKVIAVPTDICVLSTQLVQWLGEVEACKVRKMDEMCNAVTFAAKVCDKRHGCHEDEHTPCLQRKILNYFEDGGDRDTDTPIRMNQTSPFLLADIKVFLQSNSNAKFTPRAVARIFHGLSSPAFPSAIWSTTHFWKRYVHLDFRSIMEAAKKELISFVGKDLN